MKKIIFLLLFPVIVYAQGSFVLSKETESKGYSQALAEYINTVYTKAESTVDTLFIGRHEEFPDIKLPASIGGTKIMVLTTEEAEKKFQYRKSMTYINVVGTFVKGDANFMLVTFIAEKTSEKINWWPKHNSHIDLIFDPITNDYTLNTFKFDYPYSNKYTGRKN